MLRASKSAFMLGAGAAKAKETLIKSFSAFHSVIV